MPTLQRTAASLTPFELMFAQLLRGVMHLDGGHRCAHPTLRKHTHRVE